MIARRDNGSRGGRVDTSKVRDRLRDEAEESIERAKRLTDTGDKAEAIFWADYAVALMGLLDDGGALTVIAIHEMELDR